MSNRTLFTWAALLFAGCGGETKRMDAAVDTAAEPTDFAGDANDSAMVESDLSQGAWWRMHASLVIEEGELSLAETFFDVEMMDETRTPFCSAYALSSEAIREELTPHETVEYWWTIGVESWTGTCQDMGQDDVLPVEFQLGLGVMHPEILAVLDKLDEVQTGADELLHSAYASFDFGESVLVFGAAGTQWDFAGEPAKSKQVSLNGTYFVHPLYPFSIDAD